MPNRKVLVRFGRNENGQLEHRINIGDYTLHVIVYKQLTMEQLDYVLRQYLTHKHRGRIPLRGEETIKIPELNFE